jgi:hypothetical protein
VVGVEGGEPVHQMHIELVGLGSVITAVEHLINWPTVRIS